MSLHLTVRCEDPAGETFEAMSEDVSDCGIRLRLQDKGPAELLANREEVSLEIRLHEEVSPVVVQARLIWAYSSPGGGSLSGWNFVHFKGNARRRLRIHLDRCESED